MCIGMSYMTIGKLKLTKAVQANNKIDGQSEVELSTSGLYNCQHISK